MFTSLIHSGLKDDPYKFFEVINDETVASAKRGGWQKVRLGFTLLEMAHSLIESFNEVKTFSDKDGFDGDALCGLPYKAALCAKAAFTLAASENSKEHTKQAKGYYALALKDISTVEEKYPQHSLPYKFTDIRKPPKLLQSVVMP